MSRYTPHIKTHVAHWGWHEHGYFGNKVFEKLAGHSTLTDLTLIAITGTQPTPELRALVDTIAGVIVLADPRIWPLKIARLIACYGDVTAGVCAGTLALSGAAIGSNAVGSSAYQLARWHQLALHAFNPEAALATEINRTQRLWGFGIPFRPEDERFTALRQQIEQQGRQHQPFWSTMEHTIRIVAQTRHLSPNVSWGIAAAALDAGLDAKHIGTLTHALLQHMFFANAIEAKETDPMVLRILSSKCLSYTGPHRRRSPRAMAQARSIAKLKPVVLSEPPAEHLTTKTDLSDTFPPTSTPPQGRRKASERKTSLCVTEE